MCSIILRAGARPACPSSQPIRALFEASARTREVFLEENGDALERAVDLVAEALGAGRKLLLFGNGGSAAGASSTRRDESERELEDDGREEERDDTLHGFRIGDEPALTPRGHRNARTQAHEHVNARS